MISVFNRLFPFKSKLDRHLKQNCCLDNIKKNNKYKTVQKGERKMIQCRNCEKCFTEKKYFRKHYYDSHLDKSNMKCEICDKVYKNSVVLQMHCIQTHRS